MKALITSDLQFSEQARLSHRLEEGITSRLRDQVQCFDWIVETGKKHGCKQLLALGDIFDSRTSIPVPVIDQACRCFERARTVFDEIIEVVGNHDSALRHPGVNSLRAMSGLATVIEKPTVVGPFAFVPWIEDPDDFRAAVGKVAKVKTARYLFSHVMIVGAVPADVGRALSDLRPGRWKRVFLGDVHDPVKLEHGVQYVGAPMQHHYGDAGGKRGVWVLDIVSGAAEFIENPISPRFHVLTSNKTKGVRRGDFVRIRVEDPVQARAIAASARKLTSWIESEAVELDNEIAPRLDITAAASHRETLQRYVKHRDPNAAGKALVECGLSILAEVQG